MDIYVFSLWEFEVKPGARQRFQEVYGPGGDWDSLFHSIRTMQNPTVSRHDAERYVPHF